MLHHTLWHNFLNTLNFRALARRRHRRTGLEPQVPAQVESLETRMLLSAGTLDPNFGEDGTVITDIGRPSHDTATDVVAYQSSGQALVLGNSSGRVTVIRYETDGSIDGTFGDLGVAQVPLIIDGGRMSASSISVDGQDRILIAGTLGFTDGSGRADFAIIRLTPGGELDTSFNTDGFRFIDFDARQDSAAQVAVDSQGRIVIAGHSSGGFSVARILEDGTLDASFSDDGKHHFDIGGGAANSVAIDAEDRILMGGYITGPSYAEWDLAVARLTESGLLDSDFDSDGVQTIDFNGKRDTDGKVAVDSQGRIVIMGQSLQGGATGADIAVARLDEQGNLDAGFSADGKQLVDINSQEELPIRLALDSSDRILIGGESRAGGTIEEISVVRLSTAGELDVDFDADGIRLIDFGDTIDTGGSLAVDSFGNILVAGSVRVGRTSSDIALARLTDTGAFDVTFSNDGRVVTDVGIGSAGDFATEIVAHQPDGKIVVVGRSGSEVAVVRYHEDGSRDFTFGDRGIVKLDTDPFTNGDRAWGVHVDELGRTVVVANGRQSFSNSGTRKDIFVYRLLGDGSLDPTFGTNGLARLDFNSQDDTPSSMAVDSQGRLVIAGRSGSSPLLIRLLSTGMPDPSFDTTAAASLGWFPIDVAIDADNQIVVAGQSFSDFAVGRFLETGAIDTGFDGDGIQTVNIIDANRDSSDAAHSVVVDRLGRIIVTGDLFNFADSSSDVGVIRLNSDGSLDTSFDHDGKLSFDFGADFDRGQSVDVDSFNRVLVAGYTQSATDDSSNFAVARINPDGTFDLSFDGDGKKTIDLGGTSESVASVFVDHRGRILLAGQANGDIAIVRLLSNEAPMAVDGRFDVVENTPNDTAIGTVLAIDPDNDTLTYSILSGNELGTFVLNATTGGLYVADTTKLDFEDATLPKSYTLEVLVDDGQGVTDTATVTINLLNQASITGTVFVDTNQNSCYDANETGIDGVALELIDDTGAVVESTVTSDGGFYLFEDRAPGTYQIHEIQPTGVDDGVELFGNLSDSVVVANDVMQLTLERMDASDYQFAEFGQSLGSGDTAPIGFWQNKHGQQLIEMGGTALADWLTDKFGHIFGNELLRGNGIDVAKFYNEQLFKQKAKTSSGPAKVDTQFMAVALATFFTNGTLAGDVAVAFGFHVTDTGIGTKIINVGSSGAAFNVADNTDLTIMQLLLATNDLTADLGEEPDPERGFTSLYDQNGNGVIDSVESTLRSMANDLYSMINEQGAI